MQFVIRFSNAIAEFGLIIYNSQGQIIINKEMIDNETIDTKELIKGFYFIYLKTKNGEVFNSSFIKS